MKDPHLLLAGGNCRKILRNVSQLLDAQALAALESEIAANAKQLFVLGEAHYEFATTNGRSYWRQRTSRLYYAAYSVHRAIRLYRDGHYSTESSEHKKIDQFPADFPNASRYAADLPTLREDRNLADYDHTAEEVDLAIAAADAESLVEGFLADARAYLMSHGLQV